MSAKTGEPQREEVGKNFSITQTTFCRQQPAEAFGAEAFPSSSQKRKASPSASHGLSPPHDARTRHAAHGAVVAPAAPPPAASTGLGAAERGPAAGAAVAATSPEPHGVAHRATTFPLRTPALFLLRYV